MIIRKNRVNKSITNRCFWCRRKFGATSYPNKKFCSLKCGEKYRKIRDRVYNIFQFDYETINRELQKLEKMGNNYIFPNPHQDLNLFYELKGDNNIE